MSGCHGLSSEQLKLSLFALTCFPQEPVSRFTHGVWVSFFLFGSTLETEDNVCTHWLPRDGTRPSAGPFPHPGVDT